MKVRGLPIGLAGLLALSGTSSASDFGLEYAIERAPSTQLSLSSCVAAIEQGSKSAGYITRSSPDQGTARIFISGPKTDGKSLVAYCIQAGAMTVYVVQAFDYTGPGGAESARVKQSVVQALKRATKPNAK